MRRRLFLAALALSARLAGAEEVVPQTPAYLRRGDAVDARDRIYRERLERVYEGLTAFLAKNAPERLGTLREVSPPVVTGFQVLPRLIADPPRTAAATRVESTSYSWKKVDGFLDADEVRLAALESRLVELPRLAGDTRAMAAPRAVDDYVFLAKNHRLIDSHIRYNRLWQADIAGDRARYERLTRLHDAVLERQSAREALEAAPGARGRDAVSLGERERRLLSEIREAAGGASVPAFVHVERAGSSQWIVRVPVYTDVEDGKFLGAFRRAVEDAWQVPGEPAFRVVLEMRRVTATRLYRRSDACARARKTACVPPVAGAALDLKRHLSLFPRDGTVLTTGATMTVVSGRAITLGPGDLAPNVLAHELGHLLGFRDAYFRGFRDAGDDGFEVLEIGTDPDDIMSAPGFGRVGRHHFERLVGIR